MKLTTIPTILVLGLTGRALAVPGPLGITPADLATKQILTALREIPTSFKTSVKKNHAPLSDQPVAARDALLSTPNDPLDVELDVQTFTVTKALIPVLTSILTTETYVITKPTPVTVIVGETSTVVEYLAPQPLAPEPTPQPEPQTEHHTTTVMSTVSVIVSPPALEAPPPPPPTTVTVSAEAPPPPPSTVTVSAEAASPASTPLDWSRTRNGETIMYNLDGLPDSYKHCFNFEEQNDVGDDYRHMEIWERRTWMWCYSGPIDIGNMHKSLPAWIDANITPCVRTMFGEPSKEDNEQLRNWIEWLCREDIYLNGGDGSKW